MSFRNRPVLDRKHRPRWQDELRTQQLIVAGFALAIAAAIGIFAATAWFGYYDAHLRPVAVVGETTYNLDDLNSRMDVIGSELQSRYLDIGAHVGGVRDSIIQQEQGAIQQALQTLASTSSDSLVLSRVLTDTAARYGISVSDAAVSAEVTRRQTLGERLNVSLITVAALPTGAKPGDQPTDADWARALADIKAIADQIKGGADFATVAKDKSSDSSASSGGLLGWLDDNDQTYATYFSEAHSGTAGQLVGPIRDVTGFHLLRLEKREAAGPNQQLQSLLASTGVSSTTYRTYIRGELLRDAFNTYFSTTVVSAYEPQQEVSQILIKAPTGPVVPQQRVRHFLAQPIPGGTDQTKATDAQWAAALARAQAFRVEASKPDADWFKLALMSDDTGSASAGGDLGWYDAASSQFVPEFKTAIAGLTVGQLSQPVKTQFGYHIIEVTASRSTPGDQATQLVSTLRQHPDQFAQQAREQSEDPTTAAKGGDLGWVIRYQFEKALDDAIFALTKPDQISDPIQTTTGFTIFKLVASSPLRFVPAQQLDSVRQTGFDRWLTVIRNGAHTWVDPQYAAAPTAG